MQQPAPLRRQVDSHVGCTHLSQSECHQIQRQHKAGVNNLFNRKSPIFYAGTGNAGSPPLNPAYDIDRYWYVSYNQKF